ncbi:MAG: hypothetical protein RL326_1083 [Pseudomonadota bacterium]|jgi:hypothetical protein
MRRERLRHWFWILLVATTFFVATSSLVTSNSRYFYHEDDAHHFNHTVEMAQEGRLNPHYFNKPALHFYLRIPVVYASAAWEKFQGRLGSLKEIRTRNAYGVGDYAFTPSHPNILIWNRLESVAWCALIGILVFTVTLRLTNQLSPALLASAITYASPEFLKNSYIIGVDTLMALMCLACTAVALAGLSSRSLKTLTLCAFTAGLACAAKYNAAPIAIVPLTLWALKDSSIRSLFVVGAAGLAGFFAGAPFSFLAFDEFWKGISFELWHYAVAGHVGNTAERGFPQIRFYSQWLVTDGIGWLATIFALVGSIAFLRRDRERAIVLGVFPFAYCALMVMQRANFTRNMVVMIPYLAVYAAYAFSRLGNAARRSTRDSALLGLVAVCMLALPLARSAVIIRDSVYRGDSRDALFVWFKNIRQVDEDVAVAGQLQVPWELLNVPGVDSFDLSKTPLDSLITSGYRHVIIPSSHTSLLSPAYEVEWRTAGDEAPQRIPNNPSLTIAKPQSSATIVATESLAFANDNGRVTPLCPPSSERHCWIQSSATRASIPSSAKPATIEVMSPWRHQHIRVTTETGQEIVSAPLDQPGVWTTISIPPLPSSDLVVIHISQIHSAASQGISKDTRRLGLAIRR